MTFKFLLNTFKFPNSEAGDYSDVRIVSPFEEIKFNELSRISDEEMKQFMKQIVNNIYTILKNLDLLKRALLSYPNHWDEHEENKDFIERFKAFKILLKSKSNLK